MEIVVQGILDKFKSLLLQRISLYKIILFGSRARGDSETFSDLDVVVIVEDDLDDELSDYISECAWRSGFEHGIVVVPIVYSKEEWENGPERNSIFVKTVDKEGIPI